MSDQPTIEVRGNALYLELSHPAYKYTFQLLAHPDGFAASGAYVPFGVYFRSLSTSYPKRPWSTSTVPVTLVKRVLDSETNRPAQVLDPAEVNRITEVNQKFVSELLEQLVRQGYELRRQPVVVEVSSVDLNDLADGTTPYALFRRVMSARKTLGFPDDLVAAN